MSCSQRFTQVCSKQFGHISIFITNKYGNPHKIFAIYRTSSSQLVAFLNYRVLTISLKMLTFPRRSKMWRFIKEIDFWLSLWFLSLFTRKYKKVSETFLIINNYIFSFYFNLKRYPFLRFATTDIMIFHVLFLSNWILFMRGWRLKLS